MSPRRDAPDDLAGGVDRRPPAAVAAICDREPMTYGELQRAGRELAGGLLAAGIEPGEPVAMLLPNSNEWLQVAYAVSHMGCTLVPLSTWAVDREILEILRHSDAAAMISVDRFLDADYVPTIMAALADSELALRVAFVDSRESTALKAHPFLYAFSDLHVAETRAASDVRPEGGSEIGALLYTSGTTGAPKGVMLNRAALAENGRNVARHVGLRASDRTFNTFSFAFSAGYCNVIHSAVAAGACIVTSRRFDPVDAAAQLTEFACTGRSMWLDVYKRMAALPGFDFGSLAALKGLLPIPAAVGAQGFRDHAVNMWGMTETCAVFTSSSVRDDERVRLRSYGRPFPGTDLKIVDPASGKDVSVGMEGEIYVRGYNLMEGYLRAPTPFDDQGYFHTGDSGLVDEEGGLHYHGRLKGVIKSRGFTIYPEEIEAVLRSHSDVEHVAVVDVESVSGTIVVALVSAVDPAAPTSEELELFCAHNLSKYKIPTVYVVPRDQVPITATGKVIRDSAREIATALASPLPIKV